MKKTLLATISKDELNEIVLKCNTYKDVLILLGFENPVGSSYRCLKDKLLKFNISTEHMCHYNNSNRKYIKNEEIFCKDSNVTQSCLRSRVLKEHIVEYKCSICGNTGEWNGKSLTLTLDHINGNRNDNRVENLRFLCPNCDRQQDTYGAKNKTRYFTKIVSNNIDKARKCTECGAEISYKSKGLCSKCSHKKSRKVQRPEKEELEYMIKNIPFVQISKKYNVSDNTVRKWCKSYELPYRKRDIEMK